MSEKLKKLRVKVDRTLIKLSALKGELDKQAKRIDDLEGKILALESLQKPTEVKEPEEIVEEKPKPEKPKKVIPAVPAKKPKISKKKPEKKPEVPKKEAGKPELLLKLLRLDTALITKLCVLMGILITSTIASTYIIALFKGEEVVVSELVGGMPKAIMYSYDNVTYRETLNPVVNITWYSRLNITSPANITATLTWKLVNYTDESEVFETVTYPNVEVYTFPTHFYEDWLVGIAGSYKVIAEITS